MVTTGWIDDPWAVADVCSTLANPIFESAAPQLKGVAANQDLLFWELEEKVFGYRLDASNQRSVGSCVGWGFSRNVQDLFFMGIVQDEARFEWPSDLPRKGNTLVAVESVYGPSRVEIGGGRVNGDGSVGAWAAKAVNQMGVLFRKVYQAGGKTYDLSQPSEANERAWGRYGAPDALEPEMAKQKVGDIALCTTATGLRDAIIAGCAAAPCSSIGFTEVRDAMGFCRPSGTWNHCMATAGTCVVKGNIPAVAIRQSWGPNSPRGNDRVVLESGREIVLPPGVFLVRLEHIDMMVRQRDTWVMSRVPGFPRTVPAWDRWFT